jgi:amidase
MGRTVADAALMLDAMAGPHPAVPLGLPAPQTPFLAAASTPRAPRRVAFSPDLGITPVDAEVAAVCRAAARRCEALGATVDEAHPDMGEAPEAFRVLRGVGFAASLGPLVDEHPGLLKPEIEGNVALGRSLTGDQVAWAERSRGALTARARAFFERYDLLICPAACAQPFPVETRWLEELDGYRFEHYVDWLRLASAITLVGCPVVALPGGFTAAGLPVGLQLVGRPGGEHRLLAVAAALEAELDIAGRVPLDPRIGW